MPRDSAELFAIEHPKPLDRSGEIFEARSKGGELERKKKPSRAQRRRILELEMKEKGLTQLMISDKIRKSTGSVSWALKDDKATEEKFEEYLRDIVPMLGFSGLDHFDDHVRLKTTGGIPGADYCLSFGGTQTLWFPAINAYERGSEGRADDFQLRFRTDPPLVIDDELKQAVAQTHADHAAGKYRFKNGDVLHLADAQWRQPEGPNERRVLSASLVPHEYALFFTLSSTPHGRALLHDRLRHWKRNTIIPELSGGVGVNVAIATADNAFIFGRRAANDLEGAHTPRAEQLDAGAVEGLHAVKDLAGQGLAVEAGSRWDMRFTALRALKEEYGISAGEVTDVRFLGFGLDLQYGQWNILALGETRLTGDSIRRRNRRAVDGEEFLETFAIEGGPGGVFEFLMLEKRQIWSCALVLTYYAMINLYGEDAVERAVDGFDFRSPDRLA